MRVVKNNLFGFGRQRVNKLRSSTGIYGRHVGGSRPNNAVRARGRR